MSVRKVSYCHITVPNRAGQGANVLEELKGAGVNLLGYSGFPVGKGKSQIDLVAKRVSPIRTVARRNGWRVSEAKKGFLIQGRDRPGAVHNQVRKLAERGINITAADAACAGGGRYGMLLWVRPKDYAKAAKALKAR